MGDLGWLGGRGRGVGVGVGVCIYKFKYIVYEKYDYRTSDKANG